MSFEFIADFGAHANSTKLYIPLKSLLLHKYVFNMFNRQRTAIFLYLSKSFFIVKNARTTKLFNSLTYI